MACSPSVVVGAEANSGANADELSHNARMVEIAGPHLLGDPVIYDLAALTIS
jgi:hypothetical protein